MNKIIPFIFALIVSAGLRAQSPAPLYLNIGSHNESTDPLDYSNSGDFTTIKNILLSISDTVQFYNAKWNMQVDANFVKGVIQNDAGASSSTDILEWADAQAHINVNPHNHFIFPGNPYNYADVMHLLDSCGVSDHKIVGGFIWSDSTEWYPMQTGVSGFAFPSYIWQPDVLWGGGSPNHTNDINDYGIWKPNRSNSLISFRQHNSSRHLWLLGGGCPNLLAATTDPDSIVANIESLLWYINTQPVTANTQWNATIMMNFRNMSASYPAKLGELLRKLQPYVNSGQIVWMNLEDKFSLWNSTHSSSDYYQSDCNSIPLAIPQVTEEDPFSIFPNPAADNFYISGISGNETVELFDARGTLAQSYQLNGDSNAGLNTSSLAGGAYLVRITGESGVSNRILVVQH